MKKAVFLLSAVFVLMLANVVRADFVCPVFNPDSQAGAKNPNAQAIGGGDTTIIGPNLNVPDTATNQNGAGSPGGPHAAPGDAGYTAIWNTG